MIIETLNLKNHKTMRIVRLTKVVGRKVLLAAGFQCAINPKYMTNNVDFAHFNAKMKCWIIESVTA